MRTSKLSHVPARHRALLAASTLTLLPLLVACGSGDDAQASTKGDTPASAGPSVTFTSPADGDRIHGSIDLEMVAEGVVIEEAGEVREGAGHLHVTTTGECVAAGEAIPKDPDHFHFGKGQLEDKLYLPPGTHELCLQVGDGAHVAQPITSQLTVHVGVETREEWCAVSNEIDELQAIEYVDGDATIDEMKAVATKSAALAAQLGQRTDLVSEVARDDVAAMIDGFLTLTTVIQGSPDEATAKARLEEAFAEVAPEAEAGSHWIESNCKVS